MKVYFSSSLRAKKLYKNVFEKIFNIIQELGHKNTSDFLIKAAPKNYYHRTGKDFAAFYQTLTKQIKQADVCVFEVSLHSLGIGYCVDLALQMNKPVILLYQKSCNPIFFKGIRSERVQLCEYESEAELKGIIKDALAIARRLIDIRFTFFISPKINRFLSWIAKNKKIPRAVYLRGLLEEAMEKENFK